MISIRLWTQSLGIVISVWSPCTDLWNTWCLTSKTSKIPSIEWGDISKVNPSLIVTLIMSKI